MSRIAKKGQFYIFAAILMSVFIMTLATTQTRMPVESPFKRLHENYMYETPKIINSALYNDTSPSTRLANFTITYMEYARTIDPRFELMYAYNHDGVTDIMSQFSQNVNITHNGQSFLLRQNSTVINGTGFTAQVDGRTHTFNFSKEVRLRALFISKSAEGTHIYQG